MPTTRTRSSARSGFGIPTSAHRRRGASGSWRRCRGRADEGLRVLGELGDRRLVVVVIAYVAPVTVEAVRRDRLAGVERAREHVGEVDALVRSDELEDPRVEGVGAHAH